MIKKIAILGDPSSGKTALTEKLAGTFNTNFVPDYYKMVVNDIPLETPEDFYKLISDRQSLEIWLMGNSKKYIFADTEELNLSFKTNSTLLLGNIYDLYILVKNETVNTYYTGIKKILEDKNFYFIEYRNDNYKDIKHFIQHKL